MVFIAEMWIFILSLIINTVLIFITWTRRKSPSGRAFLLLMVLGSICTVTYIFELAAQSLSLKTFFVKLQFIAIAFVPLAWLYLVLSYLGRALSRISWCLLSVIPVITNLIIWFIPPPNLFWGDVGFAGGSSRFLVLDYDYGPWFYYVHAPFGYIVMLTAYIFLVRKVASAQSTYRNQIILMLIAFLPTLGTDILYVLGYSPIEFLNFTTAVLSISLIVMAWALFRHDFLDLMPVARDKVIENMHDGIIVLDNKRRIVDVNPAGMMFTGISAHDISRQISEISCSIISNTIEEMFQSDTKQTEVQINAKETNDLRIFDLRLSIIKDQSAQVQGSIVTIRDYTEKIKSEAEVKFLNEQNRIKDEFLAITSHELRTPLNSMISITQSITGGAEGIINPEQKAALSLVIESGKRLSNLINDILDYTRIKNGELVLQKSFFKIEDLVENLMKEFSFISSNKNITIQADLQTTLPEIYADKYRIIQVIYNLMDNAVKFTPAGGKISLRVYQKQQRMCISIRDTGIGIPEDKLEGIFKSYEQVDGSITRTYGGMGLGLSISKRIAETHSGSIEVWSVINQGSEFTFSLPLAEGIDETQKAIEQPFQPRETKVAEATKWETAGRTDDTIVVIDDNYSNIAGVVGILKSEGYSLKGFINPAEGLEEIFTNRNVVLAIVDIMMPEISGYEICQKTRERYSLYEMPILMLTAKTQVDSVIRSLKEGANDILYKPFDGEELKARVNTLCQLKATTDVAINNEIAMLQAQINPHFLYNAMNAIIACCYDDAEKAAEAMLTLSDYFMYSFDINTNANDIPLKQEIGLVNTYLTIEKLRFDNRLKYEIEMKEIEAISIAPFTIQPIVENAVRHGITKKEEGGLIKITGSREGRNYKISVEDTGIGIDEEDLLEILEGRKADGTGVGLMNVKQRLKKLYGTDMVIQSTPGLGTKVTMTIKTSNRSMMIC